MESIERPPRVPHGSNLADMVHSEILKNINDGTWAPSTRLPSEADLARRFGISRPVVRQALARLRESGVIRSHQGSGSFVRDVPKDGPATSVLAMGTPSDLEATSELRGSSLAGSSSFDHVGLVANTGKGHPLSPGDPASVNAEIDELPARSAEHERAPRYERLQRLLREDILEGRLQAGERLKVSEIAKRYSTSTNPAREALQALEGEGLVVIDPNRGARVRAIDEDLVRNIFDIRDMIEPYLARGFAEFALPSEIDALEALQNACQAAGDRGDYAAFHRANVAFHDFIVERHHNVEAVRIMKQHSAWIRTLRRRNPLTLANMRRSNADHWEFIRAVRRGDADAAAAAMQRHVANSHAVFAEHMRRDRVLRRP